MPTAHPVPTRYGLARFAAVLACLCLWGIDSRADVDGRCVAESDSPSARNIAPVNAAPIPKESPTETSKVNLANTELGSLMT
jgi:hypothetical protein